MHILRKLIKDSKIPDIKLNNISVSIGEPKRILFRFKSLQIKTGERVLVKGPSGVGKTTLLHLIAGLFTPDEGEVIIGDKTLGKLSDNERSAFRRKHIGIIFQKLNLIEHLTVLENAGLQMPETGDAERKCSEALDKVGMTGFSGRLSANLSLGEQQRVAVARVLSFSPDIVLADEPTSSLDEANSNIIIESLLKLPASATLITVSHDHRIENRFSRIINFSDLK